MSKKLPFSRSLCPFCAALEREQNSVDSKISAGAPGLRGTGKRSGKGARFPSAWREQALVSGVSMGRGKQISPFKASHAVLEGNVPLAAGRGERDWVAMARVRGAELHPSHLLGALGEVLGPP